MRVTCMVRDYRGGITERGHFLLVSNFIDQDLEIILAYYSCSQETFPCAQQDLLYFTLGCTLV